MLAQPPLKVPPSVTVERVHVPVADGEHLLATCFSPADLAPSSPVTIIAPAVAAPQVFYAAFATALAERGGPVFTFDYRGIAASADPTRPATAIAMSDWGVADMPAMIAHARNAYPSRPLHWVGQSFGAWGIGLAHNNGAISRQVSVSMPHGYWGDMDAPERYRVWALMAIAMPLITSIVGKLPGRLLGGEDLPTAAALEWRRVILAREAVFSLPIAELRHFAQLSAAMLCLRCTDDAWVSTTGLARMTAHFTGAAITTRDLAPADVGGAAIGHLGFFKPRFAQTLWPIAFDWLQGAPAAA
jgi:predicted alpha/beta hydrolase